MFFQYSQICGLVLSIHRFMDWFPDSLSIHCCDWALFHGKQTLFSFLPPQLGSTLEGKNFHHPGKKTESCRSCSLLRKIGKKIKTKKKKKKKKKYEGSPLTVSFERYFDKNYICCLT